MYLEGASGHLVETSTQRHFCVSESRNVSDFYHLYVDVYKYFCSGATLKKSMFRLL